MTKHKIIEDSSGFKAVNAFIFAGSFSLGTMRAGFDLEKVLEISDTQLNENAFYFKKNVEDVPVVLPKEWENDAYLDNMRNEDIDLMCCNCPCSSLSKINRNASVDGKNNVHFYRLFNIFKHVQPKTFIIENAPTLIKLGYPILKDMVNELSHLYKFTVVRDFAGNHEVAMSRQRTLVFGWRNNTFSKIPVIKQSCCPKMTVAQAFDGIIDDTTDDFMSQTVDSIKDLFKYAIPGFSLFTGLAMRWRADEPGFRDMITKRLKDTSFFRELMRVHDKVINEKSCWDKSPYKLKLEGRFPSLTSVNEYLHPTQDRMINLKELARIMNYPDWYDFTDKEHECKIPVTQAIAQGVPANFGKYAAAQARLALEGKLDFNDDVDAVMSFQHHCQHKMSLFTRDEVKEMKEVALKPDSCSLED